MTTSPRAIALAILLPGPAPVDAGESLRSRLMPVIESHRGEFAVANPRVDGGPTATR